MSKNWGRTNFRNSARQSIQGHSFDATEAKSTSGDATAAGSSSYLPGGVLQSPGSPGTQISEVRTATDATRAFPKISRNSQSRSLALLGTLPCGNGGAAEAYSGSGSGGAETYPGSNDTLTEAYSGRNSSGAEAHPGNDDVGAEACSDSNDAGIDTYSGRHGVGAEAYSRSGGGGA